MNSLQFLVPIACIVGLGVLTGLFIILVGDWGGQKKLEVVCGNRSFTLYDGIESIWHFLGEDPYRRTESAVALAIDQHLEFLSPEQMLTRLTPQELTLVNAAVPPERQRRHRLACVVVRDTHPLIEKVIHRELYEAQLKISPQRRPQSLEGSRANKDYPIMPF